jgi:hypothetical protein
MQPAKKTAPAQSQNEQHTRKPKELTTQQKLIINHPEESIKSFLTDYFNIHKVERILAETIPNTRGNRILIKLQRQFVTAKEKGVENE